MVSEARKDAEDLVAAIPEFVPVGCILPWLKSLTGTPSTLPTGFLECNGQVVDDRDSPFHAGTLPNLNGENRFLRGNATTGATGGSDTHFHAVTGTTAGPSATVNAPTGIGQTVAGPSHNHSTNFTTGTADTKPPYYNVVWIIRIK